MATATARVMEKAKHPAMLGEFPFALRKKRTAAEAKSLRAAGKLQ
jgi:hypothetical protein